MNGFTGFRKWVAAGRIVLAVAGLAAGVAHAACNPIDRLPYVVNQPGDYCVVADLQTTGDGITILANDVTVDLQGYRIRGTLDIRSYSSCIVSFGYRNITVRNGSIRGCSNGIYLSDYFDRDWLVGFKGGGHVVEDMEITGSTFRGMRVEGNGNIMRRNVLNHVGGSIIYPAAVIIGIESLGPGAIIDSNLIHEMRGVTYPGEGVGIAVNSLGSGTMITRNRISMASHERAQAQGAWAAPGRSTWGIWAGGPPSRGMVIEDNVVTNAIYGITVHRTAQAILSRNAVVGAVIPFYLPSLPDPPLSTLAGENICDKEVCLERFETEYLPPEPPR